MTEAPPPPCRVFTDGVDFAWLDQRVSPVTGDPEELPRRPAFYRVLHLRDVAVGWHELSTDEMAAALIEANEGLGDALVSVNLALGLPASASAGQAVQEIERIRRISDEHGG